MHRLVLGLLAIGALTTIAEANGRPPGTSTITFQPGRESTVYAGMSFGLLISKDNGATWSWMCEDALPYGGMYDPDYALLDSGTVFATTFDGLKENRDGCVYGPTVLAPPGPDLKFFSTITRGPDNALYVASSDPTDSKIYKSTDEGVTFPTSSNPGVLGEWYLTLEVAPSDATRLYLTSFRFVQGPNGTEKRFFLYKSTDGAMTWTSLPVTDFTLKSNSQLEIVGIAKTNADLVYARVVLEDNAMSDAIYKSTNGGANWTRIYGMPASLAFVVRANGHLVVATKATGSFLSTDQGSTWSPLTGAPHINCLAENRAGEVWACTQNYGAAGVPKDGYGIMKSTDLVTWSPLLRYEDITAPVACAETTLQYQKCDRPANGFAGWCGLCEQLGCDPKRTCAPPADDAPVGKPKDGGGCCDARDGGVTTSLFATVSIAILGIRRRRRRSSS